MKVVVTYLCSLLLLLVVGGGDAALPWGNHANSNPTTLSKADLRGGATIGPMTGGLALQLAKTATTAYMAGSAAKVIAKQTNGKNSQLTDFLTTDLWQLNALCTALSCAMYHLDATGFQPLKLLAVSHAVALVLAVDSKIRADPTKVTPYILMDFKVQSIITLALMVLAFA